MAYCINCGRELAEEARYCAGCGKSVNNNPSTRERKIYYEGILHKCPNCGEVLNSFSTHCPSCGYEIRDARSSNAIRELAQKIELIDAECMAPIQEKKSLMKMIFGKDFKEEDEIEEAEERFNNYKKQQKSNLIINFSVPNTQEDFLEFMILASSNIDVKNGITDDVTKAWIAKLEQVYEKAKLLMSDKPSFTQIKYIYDCKKKQIKNLKYKGLSTACFIVGGYTVLMSVLLFMAKNIIASIILLMIGIVILSGGIKCISIYNKIDKLNL